MCLPRESVPLDLDPRRSLRHAAVSAGEYEDLKPHTATYLTGHNV